MRSSVLLAVAVLLPAAAQERSPVTEWIASHAIRLNTPEAGHGFDDLQPLKQVIGDARIVSLGEATHGTREFFQLKARMLEFLATQMGFTIFSIEANMPEAYRLNDYVLTGQGDPAKLLKGMYFWTWDTEEVLAMIHWMREFNQSGKGRVEFTGFDMQTPNVAVQVVNDFVAKYAPGEAEAVKAAGETAVRAARTNGGGGGAFGVATGTFPVAAAAGKKIRFSGYIKTDEVADGWAGLWWRVDGKSGVLAFDNMRDRGAKGNTGWKEYSLELPVAADATNINFGALFPGSGTAWFDDLKIEIDGKPFEDPELFDLGFESPTPKGFYTGGNGYAVVLDRDIFHGGKQSLRMRRVSAPEPAADPKTAVDTWKNLVARLELARAAYREKQATDKEIDWAVQNARVVLQSLQLKTGEVARDRSMAENVKWIADHSPGAKMVLWAHNGHVQTVSGQSMGGALRQMFGRQMVVFGFAFNQGSFQAISQGTGQGPKNFTVPAAPAGSLDAMLASAGIPLFALDLRHIPALGPAGDWWNDPHATRSIGAVYPEDSPYAFLNPIHAPGAFDALLFVSTTTAARRNPPLAR